MANLVLLKERIKSLMSDLQVPMSSLEITALLKVKGYYNHFQYFLEECDDNDILDMIAIITYRVENLVEKDFKDDIGLIHKSYIDLSENIRKVDSTKSGSSPKTRPPPLVPSTVRFATMKSIRTNLSMIAGFIQDFLSSSTKQDMAKSIIKDQQREQKKLSTRKEQISSMYDDSYRTWFMRDILRGGFHSSSYKGPGFFLWNLLFVQNVEHDNIKEIVDRKITKRRRKLQYMICIYRLRKILKPYRLYNFIIDYWLLSTYIVEKNEKDLMEYCKQHNLYDTFVLIQSRLGDLTRSSLSQDEKDFLYRMILDRDSMHFVHHQMFFTGVYCLVHLVSTMYKGGILVFQQIIGFYIILFSAYASYPVSQLLVLFVKWYTKIDASISLQRWILSVKIIYFLLLLFTCNQYSFSSTKWETYFQHERLNQKIMEIMKKKKMTDVVEKIISGSEKKSDPQKVMEFKKIHSFSTKCDIFAFYGLDGKVFSVQETLDKMMEEKDQKLSVCWKEFLSSLPTDYFFLVRCIRKETLSSPFVIAILYYRPIPYLELPLMREANSSTYTEYIEKQCSRKKRRKQPSSTVASFPSKSRPFNNRLIIPCPSLPEAKNYVYIKSFMQQSSLSETSSILFQIASETKALVSEGHRVYINTHGLDVPWLHIRLEYNGFPKHYQHHKKYYEYMDTVKIV